MNKNIIIVLLIMLSVNVLAELDVVGGDIKQPMVEIGADKVCYLNKVNTFTQANHFPELCLNGDCITAWNSTGGNTTVNLTGYVQFNTSSWSSANTTCLINGIPFYSCHLSTSHTDLTGGNYTAVYQPPAGNYSLIVNYRFYSLNGSSGGGFFIVNDTDSGLYRETTAITIGVTTGTQNLFAAPFILNSSEQLVVNVTAFRNLTSVTIEAVEYDPNPTPVKRIMAKNSNNLSATLLYTAPADRSARLIGSSISEHGTNMQELGTIVQTVLPSSIPTMRVYYHLVAPGDVPNNNNVIVNGTMTGGAVSVFQLPLTIPNGSSLYVNTTQNTTGTMWYGAVLEESGLVGSSVIYIHNNNTYNSITNNYTTNVNTYGDNTSLWWQNSTYLWNNNTRNVTISGSVDINGSLMVEGDEVCDASNNCRYLNATNLTPYNTTAQLLGANIFGNSTIARTGKAICTGNQVMQNITLNPSSTATPQCVTPTATAAPAGVDGSVQINNNSVMSFVPSFGYGAYGLSVPPSAYSSIFISGGDIYTYIYGNLAQNVGNALSTNGNITTSGKFCISGGNCWSNQYSTTTVIASLSPSTSSAITSLGEQTSSAVTSVSDSTTSAVTSASCSTSSQDVMYSPSTSSYYLCGGTSSGYVCTSTSTGYMCNDASCSCAGTGTCSAFTYCSSWSMVDYCSSGWSSVSIITSYSTTSMSYTTSCSFSTSSVVSSTSTMTNNFVTGFMPSTSSFMTDDGEMTSSAITNIY